MKKDYKIDFEMFETLEIVKIIDFFVLIEQAQKKKVSKEKMIACYREYQQILNNKSLEKKYDKMLYDKSQVSIYQTMKKYLERP
ncbi:MAG TPA: UPF0223 family protein [Bacilli bacterium]|jgi:uncharacterized protein YktA (UPF0223 family)|nr:UPF0223 family protein [Acholeplasmataceae bacterium]HNZ77284.1 UPF0223 family protein [Bacilli bacterium]HOD60627.1 UPF0223 family protein [Bacilli bacterium]HOE06250.1 UPF0223 family protein [Bacilli bacterium]HOH60980.1 UPF0223 family protein [Bacilli bacterium]